MTEAKVAKILKLSAEESLRLVGLLSESLTSIPVDVMLGEAHREAIDLELSEHRRNPNDVLSLEQLLLTVRRSE
jgi:hypothetical protein